VTQRILHIIDTLQRGGTQTSLLQLATGLPPDRFEVHVAVLEEAGSGDAVGSIESNLRAADIPVTFIGRRHRIDPLTYARLRFFVKRRRPALVHNWGFAANSYGRSAALAAKVKAVVADESCVDTWKQWYHLAVDRRLTNMTSRVVVHSHSVRDFYIAQGIPAEKITLIASGVAAHPTPSPDAISREDLLALLQLPSDARLIGALGGISRRKQLRDVVWAEELLRVVRDDVHLLIIGDGPDRQDLMRYRDQVGLRKRVHFLGHREDALDLLNHIEMLLLGSRHEGMSYPILEAMAAGLPVICSDIPGNRELVVPEETGYLVPVGARAGLARYANILLDDTDLAKQLGEAGRARVTSQFSLARMIAAHSSLYHELLGA